MAAKHFLTSARSLITAMPADIRRASGTSIRVAPVAAAVGVLVALLWPKHFLSTASFMAESQSTRGLPSALSALADQFGLQGATGTGQSPAFFADLLESRAILLPILPMLTTSASDRDPKPLIDRLEVGSSERRDREERGLRKLRQMLDVTPDAKTNVVSFGVTLTFLRSGSLYVFSGQ